MTSLEIKQIDKHYGAVQALHDVSLSIKKGVQPLAQAVSM